MKSARKTKTGLNRAQYLCRATEYTPRGQELPQAKLLDMDVINIRSAHRQRQNLLKHIKENLSNEALCKQYGIHLRTLEKIVTRQTWSHLP